MGNRPGDAAAAAPAAFQRARGYIAAQRPSRIVTLRELRHERDLSIRALETVSGVNRAIISQVERGRMVATADELRLVERALGLALGSLQTRTVVVYEESSQ